MLMSYLPLSSQHLSPHICWIIFNGDMSPNIMVKHHQAWKDHLYEKEEEINNVQLGFSSLEKWSHFHQRIWKIEFMFLKKLKTNNTPMMVAYKCHSEASVQFSQHWITENHFLLEVSRAPSHRGIRKVWDEERGGKDLEVSTTRMETKPLWEVNLAHGMRSEQKGRMQSMGHWVRPAKTEEVTEGKVRKT